MKRVIPLKEKVGVVLGFIVFCLLWACAMSLWGH